MQSLNAAAGCRRIVVSSSTCTDVILVISEVLLAEDVSALVTQDIRITILAERNATAAKSSKNFGRVLLLNE